MADSNIPCLYGITKTSTTPIKIHNNLISKNKIKDKMSNTKQILKDAIADAKAVRETALANAKLALEEAFTPQLQSMLAAKLNEMEEEDEDKMEEAKKADDQMEETLDLEALLAEADDEEEKEAEEKASEEAPEAGEEKEGEKEEDKDITEMSPEEVEEYIRQIAAEEFEKLETEQGEEIPGEDGGEEIDLDAELGADATAGEEEINLDEMIDETEETVNEEEIDENDINIDELLAEFGLSEEEVEEGYGKDEDESKSEMEEELAQALATIDELRSSIQEVNLLNAKLLYMNKVFKGTNLTESQKIQVVKTFDKAESAKEAKLVYESMITSFTNKAEVKSNIKESVGFASKAVGMITNSNAKVIETDAQYNRWEKLAFGK
jgi:hypothetical protein